MIKSTDGRAPGIAASTTVSQAAYISGDVRIGEESVVWPCAVIRAELHPIRIGSHACIEDCCVLHAGFSPLDIGDNVIVGHGAVVHGRRIGNNVLIGMNATVLPGAVIGDSCVIAAGAVVPENATVPPKSLVAGVPGKIKRQVNENEVEDRVENLIGYLAKTRQRVEEEGF